MKQDKKSFRHESLQDRESILKILTTLVDGLEKEKLVLREGEDEMILNPQGLLQLKITATQEENRYNLGLKISWQTESKKITDKNSLQISTD